MKITIDWMRSFVRIIEHNGEIVDEFYLDADEALAPVLMDWIGDDYVSEHGIDVSVYQNRFATGGIISTSGRI